MITPDQPPGPNFVRVGNPAHLVTMRGEPTAPDGRSVSTGAFIRVQGPPQPVVTLTAYADDPAGLAHPLVRPNVVFEPVASAYVVVTLPLDDGADGGGCSRRSGRWSGR